MHYRPGLGKKSRHADAEHRDDEKDQQLENDVDGIFKKTQGVDTVP
jgi:hypothetical protein